MKPGKNLQPTEEFSEEIEEKNTLSIDEFFKQLEEKEKDLDISTELVFEIDEADFDETEIPIFLQQEKPAVFNVGENDYNHATARDKKLKTETFSELEKKVSDLQKKILKMETERVELIELARRRQNDFEGYKKRTEREKSETFVKQVSSLATQMLPVLDNFNRALESASTLADEQTLNSEHFFNGIVLVNQQLNEVLSEMGVSPIVSVGEIFDPHFHEAVATEETDEVPPHTITAELLRGYRLGDRVIRPSMVKVSKQMKSDN